MATSENCISRRDILKGFGLGAISLALGGKILEPVDAVAAPGSPFVGKGELFKKVAGSARVALVKGNDRHDNVFQALKKIEDQIISAIGNKNILIKPNFVSTKNQLAATHVDSVRAILDFLKPHYKKEIIIGESPAFGSAFDGFQNYGYMALEKEYNVKLQDMNQQPWQYRYSISGEGNRPTPIRIISAFFDPNLYIISAAVMKTHDRVVTTLSLKNILLGAPVSDSTSRDKWLMHTGPGFTRDTVLHYNIFHLAQEIYPDLGVIDGFEGMEDDGPIRGTPVDSRIALASTDSLAMDMLATKLMGFDPTRIMYLTCMAQAGMGQGDLSKVEVLGTPIEQCQYHFKVNSRLAEAYGIQNGV